MQLWVRRYPVRQGLLAFSEASVREILPYGAISLPKGTRDRILGDGPLTHGPDYEPVALGSGGGFEGSAVGWHLWLSVGFAWLSFCGKPLGRGVGAMVALGSRRLVTVENSHAL